MARGGRSKVELDTPAAVRRALERADGLNALAPIFESPLLAELRDQPLSLFLEAQPWDAPGSERLRALAEKLALETLADLVGTELRRRWVRRPPPERAWLVDSLRAWVGAELAGDAELGAPGPAAASGRPAPGWSAAELGDWAAAAGVARALGLPVMVLESALAPAARRWLWGCPPERTVGALFSLPTAAPGLSLQVSVPFAVKQAAVAWLEDQAQRVAAGRAHEAAAPLAVPTTTGPLAPLAAGLWRQWQALAPGAPAWPPDPEATLALDAEGGALVWQAPGPDCCGGGAGVTVRVALDGGALERRCACGPGVPAGCPRSRQALARLLRSLPSAAAADRAFWAEVLAVAGVPGWQRGLDLLARIVAAPAADAARTLGWRFDRDGAGVPRLRPVGARWDGSRWLLAPLGPERAARGEGGPPTAADRRVLAELALLRSDSGAPAPGLRRAVAARALVALIGHPRVFGAAGAPLAVGTATLGLHIGPGPGGGVALTAALDGVPRALGPLLPRLGEGADCISILEDGDGGAVRVISHPPDVLAFFRALHERGAVYPPEGVDALLDRVPAFEALLPVVVDAALAGARVPPRWRWAVELALVGGDELQLRVGLRVLPVPGGRPRAPGRGPLVAYGADGRGRIHADRDLDEERRACAELLDALGLDPAGATGDANWLLVGQRRVLGFVSHLERAVTPAPPTGEGVEVRWLGERVRVVAEAGVDALEVAVEKGQDWFGLGGGLRVDELELALGALLDQVRAGARFVRVGGHDFVRLDAVLRARLAALGEARHTGAVGLVGVLDALAADGARVTGDAAWAAARARVRAALDWSPPVPAGLRATLRPYQRAGFTWLARLAKLDCGAILADDMGLGKTVQTIALLLHTADQGPALVVAPTSLCANWAAELARFAPGLRVRHFRGRQRAQALAGLGPGDVLLASYALAAREAADGGPLAQPHFATVVLDEAQAVKNADTQRHQALHRLQRDRAVLLTGTPVENREDDLWSLMTFVRPSVLGGRETFRELLGAGDGEQRPDQRAEGHARLARRVAPFLLRRRKSQVARDLPPRTVQTLRIVPGPAEAARYRRAQAAAVAKLRQTHAAQGENAARFDVLAALGRLRQLACHPGLVDPTWTGASAKLARVVQLVRDGIDSGHKLLVFSQFTRFLDRVRAALVAEGIDPAWLVGSMSPAARQRAVARFQDGEAPVFLLSLLAGGTGLNLTEADRVLILDPWWNPAAEAQAADRAHRIGQERPVHVLRLVTAGTIEEKVHLLQDSKRSMVRAVLARDEAAPTDGGPVLSAELRAALLDSLLPALSEPGDAAAGRSGPG